jgi:hypothetical protein
MKVICERGFGFVEDPKTGEDINVQSAFETDRETFERLEAEYPGFKILEGGESDSNPKGSSTQNGEAQDASEGADETNAEAETDAKTETFRCGVNQCSRKVDAKDASCWQH